MCTDGAAFLSAPVSYMDAGLHCTVHSVHPPTPGTTHPWLYFFCIPNPFVAKEFGGWMDKKGRGGRERGGLPRVREREYF
jgi:hypothetical protein